MARRPRALSGPGALDPGRFYHVTHRGIDRRVIFDSDEHRLMFLSILARVSLETGMIVHAFCLMNNHFHLLVEDSRGLLSHTMLRLLGTYASWYNKFSGRTGPLFEGRFRSQLIDTSNFYDQVGSYILLNPLRVATPKVARAEEYVWSSAALSATMLSSRQWAQERLSSCGGIEAVLDALGAAENARWRKVMQHRLTLFEAGAWIDASGVRCGRSREAYARVLEARRQMPRPSRGEVVEVVEVGDPVWEAAQELARFPAQQSELPRLTDRYEGIAAEKDCQTIAGECSKAIPEAESSKGERKLARDVWIYEMWRFMAMSVERIAEIVGEAVARVQEVIRQVRQRRNELSGWDRLLAGLEWRLRWRLSGGPWRH